MKKRKNRMHLVALKNTIRKLNNKVADQEGDIVFIKRDYNQYKDRLQLAAEVIGSELDKNDLLRAMLSGAKLIEYDGEADHLEVVSRKRGVISYSSDIPLNHETFTTEFIYNFGQFVDEHRDGVDFGKIYEVTWNGKASCLFLSEKALSNVPVDYLVKNYMKAIALGLKRQLS